MRKVLSRRLISIVAVLLVAGLAGAARGQDATADAGRRQLSGEPPSDQIHVDQECRIHAIAPHTDGTKMRVFRNRGICDVTDLQSSSRYETDMADGKSRNRLVTIREHTFSLHNPTTEPVIFVLEQTVGKGWEIDSVPRPYKVEDGMATFLIQAPPGTTVNVHVGERNPPK